MVTKLPQILLLLSAVFFFFKLYIIVLVLPNIKMNPPQVYMCVCCFIPSPVETVSGVVSTSVDPSARCWCCPFRCWVQVHPISLLPAPQSGSWSFLIWMDVGSLYWLLSSIPLTWTCSCWSQLLKSPLKNLPANAGGAKGKDDVLPLPKTHSS